MASPPLAADVLAPVLTARAAAIVVSAVGAVPGFFFLQLLYAYCRGTRTVTARVLCMMLASIFDTATDLLYVLRGTFASGSLFIACAACIALPIFAYLATAPGLFLHWRRVYAAFFFLDTSKASAATLWHPYQPDRDGAYVFPAWRLLNAPVGRPGLYVYGWVHQRCREYTENASGQGRRCPLWARSLDGFVLVSLLFSIKWMLLAAGVLSALLSLSVSCLLTLPLLLLWLLVVGPVLFRTELLAAGPVAHLFYFRHELGEKPLEPRIYNLRVVAFCVLESAPQLILQTWNSKQLAGSAGHGSFGTLAIVTIAFSALNVFATCWHVVGNCVEYGTSFERWDGVETQESELGSKAGAAFAGCACCGAAAAARA